MPEPRSRASLIRRWTVIGSVMQVIMVLIGHWVAAIASIFTILGTLISLAVGVLFARDVRPGYAGAAVGGALVGGIAAFVGVAVSFAIGDVARNIIAVATLSGLVAGVLGGLIGQASAGAPSGAPSDTV